jgi:hypothetical protein
LNDCDEVKGGCERFDGRTEQVSGVTMGDVHEQLPIGSLLMREVIGDGLIVMIDLDDGVDTINEAAIGLAGSG